MKYIQIYEKKLKVYSVPPETYNLDINVDDIVVLINTTPFAKAYGFTINNLYIVLYIKYNDQKTTQPYLLDNLKKDSRQQLYFKGSDIRKATPEEIEGIKYNL